MKYITSEVLGNFFQKLLAFVQEVWYIDNVQNRQTQRRLPQVV